MFPSISVCICSYNQVKYLEDAIRSVVSQTYPPKEIIVSDDCSIDGSIDLLKKLSAEIPTLKVYIQEVNLGIPKNTDFCFRRATGEFIVRLDSDDLLLPNFTEQLLNALLKYPSAGYAHAAVQEIDEKGKYLNVRKIYRNHIFQSGDQALKNSIKGYRVTANIIMFRRKALEKVNFMTGRPNFGEDYHLTSALSSAGFGNVHINQVLSQYRVWTDAGRVRQKRKLSEITGIRKVFEEVIEPGFRFRGWNLNILSKRRSAFACHHANCLGWNFYNEEEKLEILNEIKKLSPALKVRVYCIIYLKGFGWLADIPSDIITYSKSTIKYSMLKFNKLKG